MSRGRLAESSLLPCLLPRRRCARSRVSTTKATNNGSGDIVIVVMRLKRGVKRHQQYTSHPVSCAGKQEHKRDKLLCHRDTHSMMGAPDTARTCRRLCCMRLVSTIRRIPQRECRWCGGENKALQRQRRHGCGFGRCAGRFAGSGARCRGRGTSLLQRPLVCAETESACELVQ